MTKKEFFGNIRDWDRSFNMHTRVVCWEPHNLLELNTRYWDTLTNFNENIMFDGNQIKYEDWKDFINE